MNHLTLRILSGLTAILFLGAAAPAQNPPNPAVERIKRSREDARALAKALLPEVPAGWRTRWDVKPAPSAFESEDEYWKDVVIPGIENTAITEQEAHDALAAWTKSSQVTERQAAINLYQALALECLPTAQRHLLAYSIRGILDALGRDASTDYKEFQRRSVTELCALDASLSDDQARDRFLKLATLPARRTHLTFDQCSDWAKAGQFSGPQLTQNGIKACEATIDVILINPSRTAEITDLAPGEAAATQAKLQQAYQKIVENYVDGRNKVIDKYTNTGQREAARKKVNENERAAMKAKITVVSRNVGSGGHVIGYSDYAAPPSPNVTFFSAALAPEPSWGGVGVVLPYGSRALFGEPERVCVGWLRNGSALVQVTLEGNLSEEEMLKATDFWLSTMYGRTGAYGNMDSMLKTAVTGTPAATPAPLTTPAVTPAPPATPAATPTPAPTPTAPPAGNPTPPSTSTALPFNVVEMMVDTMLEKKEFARAEEICRSAQARDPKSSKWAVGYGKLYAAQERWDEAAKSFQQALQLNPQDPSAQNGVGRALARQGKHAEALERFFEAAHLEPQGKSEYFINAAESLFALNRRDEAYLWAREAIARGLKQHPLFDKLGLKP